MKIGITMSGGGYRAAAYSLGALSYMNFIESGGKSLLKQVKALSTVSGGSITGISYAQSAKQDEDFHYYFQRLYVFLTEEDLVNEGICNFVNPESKNSLIEGFAAVYNEKLFNNKKFESILPKKGENGEYDTHLEFTCINATEFNTGTPFRFIAQTAELRHRIGNHFYKLDKQLIESMPLGIPLAASSCFPGGFEPVSVDISPYVKAASVIQRYEKNTIVSLMDGGIVDNQGIDSVLLYDNQRKQNEMLDLIMVVDVSSPNISGYEPSKEKRIPVIGNTSMIKIYRFIWMTNILLVGMLFIRHIQENKAALITISVLLTLFILATLLLSYAKRLIKKTANTNEVGIGKINRMNVLTPNAVAELFANRVNSVGLLVGSVFMKHLRRKNYQNLFGSREHIHKCFMTAIYQLKHAEPEDKMVNLSWISFYELGINEPTDLIRNICTSASKMKTTLWVPLNSQGKEKIRDVITAGQITTCANFIVYYHKICNSLQQIEKRKQDNQSTESDLFYEPRLQRQKQLFADIDKQARKHWSKFLINPWWMFDELVVSNRK